VSNEIFAIAQQYLQKVSTAGAHNLKAICPFHVNARGTVERNPSFYMSTDTGLFFCHSCGTKGNLRSFLSMMGVSPVLLDSMYKGALESVARNVAPPPDPLRPKVFSAFPIEEKLLGLFQYAPTDLLRAGFAEQTLQHFEVGFDVSHNRITFPIRDLMGQLVAISGRAVLSYQEPRYKIYDKEYETWQLPIRDSWEKSTVLYNANRVYPEVYFNVSPPPVVVVEGFKACMWVWQAGFRNVVATLGTYLSWEQKWILERLGAPVYLFLDNNRAGRRGAYTAGNQLCKSLHTSLVRYPERLRDDDGAQPDSCTIEEVQEQLANPLPWYLV